MKATGIVRRIDDLGRVVIPKEIRRTMRLSEGTPLEIFTDRDGEIIFKKYSPMAELGNCAKQYADALSQTLGHTICVFDLDHIIAVSGIQKKDYAGKEISKQVEDLIENRECVQVLSGGKGTIPLFAGDDNLYQAQIIYPVICQGDAIGAVAFSTKEEKVRFSELEQKFIYCGASFLGRQMES